MTTATDVISRATSFLGTGADPNSITRQYGPGGWGNSRLEGGYDWCAVSCYVWARLAGGGGLVSASPFVRDHVNFHQAQGTWLGRTGSPRPGDEVVFTWESNDSVDHIGYVETAANGVITTIEGNSGDAVRRRSYPVLSSLIYGYGRPKYDGSSTAVEEAAPLDTQEEDTEMKLVHHIQGDDQAIYLDSDHARTLASNIGNLDVLKARYGMVTIDTTQGTDVGLRPLDAAKAWAIANDPKNAGASPAEIARLVDAAVGDDFARVHVKLDSITKGEGDIITELRKVASSVSGIVLQVDVSTLADRLTEALGKNLSAAVANELSKRLAS